MAHNSTLNTLAGALITATTGLSSNTQTRAFKQRREATVKSLRSLQHGRTNQFEVQEHLDGLVEKFQVRDRDDLADALTERLEEFSKIRSKWKPELLAFLLQLSDRPLEKSDVRDLELLKAPPSPPQLTWAEIIAGDPLNEKGVWDDIDYAVGSSEDEYVVEASECDVSRSGDFTRDFNEDAGFRPNDFVQAPNKEVLTRTKEAQTWRLGPQELSRSFLDREPSPTRHITELQVAREVLLMLHGLPTTLFKIGPSGRIQCVDNFSLANTDPKTFHSILRSFATTGEEILQLRAWAGNSQKIPLNQTFKSSTMKRIRLFDNQIASMEQQLLDPSHPIAVSIAQICHSLQSTMAPIFRFSELVTRISRDASTFACLQHLFDGICAAQMTGESNVFKYLARIFFECLQTFLKPVRRWMELGELDAADEVFFVSVVKKDAAVSSIWHDQYTLRQSLDGSLHAPRFLSASGRKVLNAGKSIVFLKHLGGVEYSGASLPEPHLDFETVCGVEDRFLLAPFPELFDVAFDQWIRSKYSPASAVLRQRLFTECGLDTVLDALEYIYFSKDGTSFQSFADNVFEKMDSRRQTWNDRFLLTELAHEVFRNQACIQPERIGIKTVPVKKTGRSVKCLGGILVEYILPWPVLNIVQRHSLFVYQRIFTFLLQIYRAKSLLRQLMFLNLRSSPGETTHATSFLRQRLLWFVNILHDHITANVLIAATFTMRNQIRSAEDIDAMSTIHENYISRLEGQCLLTKNLAPIFQAITSILDICVLFCDSTKHHSTQQTNRKSGPMADESSSRSRHQRRRSAGLSLQRLASAQANVEESESDDEEEKPEDDYDADTEVVSSFNGSYASKLAKMQEQFSQLYGFVASGLRGVSRAGNEPTWDMLAERLHMEKLSGT